MEDLLLCAGRNALYKRPRLRWSSVSSLAVQRMFLLGAFSLQRRYGVSPRS